MRATRWLLGGLTVLLAALFAAAWALPPLLDGTQFRVPLQRIASRVLGVPVRIDGPIHLRLLPQPSLSAGALTIAAAGPRDGSLSAKGVRLQLALGPLLLGRIEARTLVLARPDLRLPGNFGLHSLVAGRPGWLQGAAALVQDGRVEGGGFALSGITASLSADPLSGDLGARGSASASGRRWRFDIRLSQPGPDGVSGLDLALAGQGPLAGTDLTLSGQLAGDGLLAGQVAAHGSDLAALLPAPAQPFRAEGRISYAQGLVAADDLAVTLGGTPARGAVALRLDPRLRLDLALAATRLDLDPWVAVLRHEDQAARLLGGLPLGIDLSAEAARLAGGTLRGLRAAFDVEPGQAEIREFRATLPGGAALRMTGSLRDAMHPRLAADAQLDAPALRATLGWMAPMLPPLTGLPASVLRNAHLAAHLTAQRGTAALSAVSGTLDGSAIGGTLAWHTGSDGAVQAIAGSLRMQDLDLDPWLASTDAAGPDLDLDIAAQHARLRGMALAPLSFSLARRAGTLTLRQARARAGAAVLGASGALLASGWLQHGTLTVGAPRLADLPWTAGIAWLPPHSPLLADPLRLELNASGAERALSLQIKAQLGALAAEADPLIDLTRLAWSGPLTLRGPSARALLEQAGLPERVGLADARWLGEGSLAVQTHAAGDPHSLSLDSLDLTAGRLHAGGSLRLSWAGPASLSGTVAADILPLPAWSVALADRTLLATAPDWQCSLQVRAKEVLSGGAALLGPFVADVSMAHGVLRIAGLEAGLSGGALHGDASFDLAADPPRFALHAKVQGANAGALPPDWPLSLAAPDVSAEAALQASGHSVAAMRSTLAGTASASAQSGTLRGVSFGSVSSGLPDEAVAKALAGGDTPFSSASLSASLASGVVTLTGGEIATAAGPVRLSGSADLSQRLADLSVVWSPAGLASPPAIGLQLEGPFGRLQRIPQLAGLARWRAARAQE